jgi:hypothetical protein
VIKVEPLGCSWPSASVDKPTHLAAREVLCVCERASCSVESGQTQCDSIGASRDLYGTFAIQRIIPKMFESGCPLVLSARVGLS